MARPLRIEYPGAFYHITARANEGKELFKGKKDRERFLYYLETATHRYRALIHVYCLMSNHYHLLLETPSGNLSQILHHINGAYTGYFNIKHQRSGHLFEGRYRAILVEADTYAKELSRYIHLNPVRGGLVDRAKDYPWSSYRHYIGQAKAPEWLITRFILAYFGQGISDAQKRYRKFIDGKVGEEYDHPLTKTVASTLLGNVDFVRGIKEKYLKNRETGRDLPALRELSDRLSIANIQKEVESVFGEDQRLSQRAGLYLCHRLSGMKLKEIGAHFGIGESAVSQASRRLVVEIERDTKLRAEVERIEKRVRLSRV